MRQDPLGDKASASESENRHEQECEQEYLSKQ
jgi:hypothetical protein